MNPFIYSLDNKRYHTLNYYYKNLFNNRVSKLSLDAHFTCPNIDGKVGFGGCIYCKQMPTNDDLLDQVAKQKEIMNNKWPNSKYIGFFQSNSNTYAPVEVLREKYELILKQPNVIGLSIATRPDAISDEVLDYLEELSKRTYLTIELGLQTIHEQTAKLINRCHTLECFTDMVSKLRQRNINVIVHIINGLPSESKEMMLQTVTFLAALDIQGLKIHMLHVVRDTPLENLYNKQPFHILTKDEYVNIVCDQLEQLPAKIVIHRLTGDPFKEDLITPTWVLNKGVVLNDIDKELARRNTYQGFNKSIINKLHQILENNLNYNDIVFDATIDNEIETLFLSKIINKGHLYGISVNDDVLQRTKELLDNNNFYNYTLLRKTPSQLLELFPQFEHKVSSVIFDFDYLSNDLNTMIKTIDESIKLLNNKGIILIVMNGTNDTKKNMEVEIGKYFETIKNNYDIKKYYNPNILDTPSFVSIKKNII